MQGIDPIQILKAVFQSTMIGGTEWEFSEEKTDTLQAIFPTSKFEISANDYDNEGSKLTKYILRIINDDGKLIFEISSLDYYDYCGNLREMLEETYNSAVRKALTTLSKELIEEAKKAEGEDVKYTVYVDDNYHYGDEDERYTLGIFDSEKEAIEAAKKVVDDFFIKLENPGNDPEKLFSQYCMYGDDPWLSPISSFKAWDYAKEKCVEICQEKKSS